MAFEYVLREGVVVDLGYGRRSGAYPAGRREVGIRIEEPGRIEGTYRLEQITQSGGQLDRQNGRVELKVGSRFSRDFASG